MRENSTTVKSIQDVSPMWNVLTSEEKKYLQENSKIRDVKKNQIIYSEGEEPTHIYCLISGKVKITKDGIGGREQIVRMIKAGENFAFRAPLAREKYITNGISMEASSFFAVPLKAFNALLKSNNKLSLTVLNLLAVDLGKRDVRVVSLTQKHIRGRLADTLLMLKDTYGLEEDGSTLSGSLSRDDLASLANMTTSNAIRTLSNFVSEGILEMTGRTIKIIDEQSLNKISRLG